MSFKNIAPTKKRAKQLGEDTTDPMPVRRMRHALNGAFSPFPKRIRTELRSSSLPFCPILFADGERKNDEGWAEDSSVSWRGQFYLDIGTAAHTLWQRVLTRAAVEAPMNVKPYGSWSCSHCGKEKFHCFLPEPCQCGPRGDGSYTKTEFYALQRKKNPLLTDRKLRDLFDIFGPYSEWEYVEIGFDYKGLTGHIDYIEYYPDTDYWMIWDLKTAMSKAVNNPKGELPVVKNIFQIEAYAHILPQVVPAIPKIDAYALLYHTRESSSLWEPYLIDWTPDRNERAAKRVNRWVNGHNAAEDYMEHQTTANLQKVVSMRPCLSEKSYKREMACVFDFKANCKFLDLCTNYESRELAERLAVKLDESLDEHRKLLKRQKQHG